MVRVHGVHLVFQEGAEIPVHYAAGREERNKNNSQRGRPDRHVHLFRLSLFLSALPTALTVTTIMKDKAVADNGDKDDGDEANEDEEEEEQ